MNEFFKDFYGFSGFGPVIKAEKPAVELLTDFKDKLPTRVLEYWSIGKNMASVDGVKEFYG
ncbi:hypothetical protein [Shewanella sp. YLB-07]|uniref:hypothetical protein n=1 Tax=Shewanella sp. YLB-07 TaxID=2601268 RepID=UPI001D136EF5|nr:hypothetical protein [Shewanella sp. YLB-07]